MQNRSVNTQKLRYLAWDMGVKKAAQKAGVSRSMLDKLINGRYSDHSLRVETMDKIASAFGVAIDEVFPFDKKKSKAS